MGEHKTILTANCKNPTCGKLFSARAYYVISGRRMYCGRDCYNATRPKGHKTSFKTDYDRKRESIARHPLRHRCRTKLRYAVQWGHIILQPCLFCANAKSEGHHFDYSKPLDVLWLCRQHHVDVHKGRITLLLPIAPEIPAVETPSQSIAHPAAT